MRVAKLAEQIKDVVATNLTTVLRDPRLTNVTITHVTLSADLQIASVYFRTLRDEHRSALIALRGASGFFAQKTRWCFGCKARA